MTEITEIAAAQELERLIAAGTPFKDAVAKARETGHRAGETVVPDALGWWLWLDGSPRGCAVFLHDPTGDGLQFDSGASSSETNLAAYSWGGRLVLEPDEQIEALVEGGRVGVSCLDSAGYLSATPTGACRRVTETNPAGESLTFEDDRRLPAASEADASELAKLEDLVREMVEGHYGAGRFIVGGLEVDIVDPRYKTKTKTGFSVAVSPAERPKRARSN